jgi:squalene-associated FAD-dependent desaturase
MSRGHVVVVGGGLAGITAALDCADAGLRVTLLERRPRLGGATWSFERHGAWFDNGQHVFLRCCTEYRALLDRIGAADGVVLQNRLSIPVLAPGGERADLVRDPLPAPLHLGRALLGYRHLSATERVRAIRAALRLRALDPDDRSLDDRSFGAWLTEHGQSPRAIAALWDLITVPTLNVHAVDASLGAAVMVFRTGLLDDARAGDIGYARIPLAALHAAPALRALHEAGVEVRTDATASLVMLGTDGSVRALQVDGVALAADAVVVAVPHEAAAPLLPAGAIERQEHLGELGTSPIVNVHVIFDRAVTDLPLAAGVGTPVQWVFDRTAASGIDSGQCLAVSLSAADAWLGRTSREIVDEIVGALGHLFPRVRGARLVDSIVTREHAATFRPAPGARQLRPGARTRIAGLYLAGAWTATGWPATMEGAVRSGHAAAAALLAERHTTSARTMEVVA